MIRGSIIILALASLVAMNGCTKCGGNAEQTPAAETTAPAPEATPDAAAAPAEGAPAADPNAAPAADGAAATPAN